MKVNLKILTANALLYRAYTTIENWFFLWLVGWLFGLYSAASGLLISVSWNILNMVSYWVWHYFSYKWFPMVRKGTTYWFTGPPGSGKTYAAKRKQKVLEAGGHTVVHLDGDIVRGGLNKDLGFSPEDRDTNIERMGYLCMILNDQGVDVVASFVSPYQKRRDWLRAVITNLHISYVSTPFAIRYERRKKLYDEVNIGPHEVGGEDEVLYGY